MPRASADCFHADDSGQGVQHRTRDGRRAVAAFFSRCVPFDGAGRLVRRVAREARNQSGRRSVTLRLSVNTSGMKFRARLALALAVLLARSTVELPVELPRGIARRLARGRA